ncbi:MAG: ergothioneine biosynthesis protein EgtB [Planctomycetota bacterium]
MSAGSPVLPKPTTTAPHRPVAGRAAVEATRPDPAVAGAHLADVRRFTESLVDRLEPEDLVVQTAPDCSPGKWHLAHTTWFFERFVLRRWVAKRNGSGAYTPMHPQYDYLFNSYYNGVGPQHCRPRRGLLSRPTVAEVMAYRREVDRRLAALVDAAGAGRIDPAPPADEPDLPSLAEMLELGAHHEQQHQELLLADLQHAFSSNPLLPAHPAAEPYDEQAETGESTAPAGWVAFQGGLVEVGLDAGDPGFRFDNETPRAKAWVEPYALADRLVTCGDYLSFIDDGGYDRPDLWLAAGWAERQAGDWQAPLYWYRDGDAWKRYALTGAAAIVPAEPVSHLSYYEADAFARWAGARLPTEFEWEHAAERSLDQARLPDDGAYAESMRWTPAPAARSDSPNALRQMTGVLWQWTSSAYAPYAGYRPLPGVLGEYNGKFMSGQQVLRGAATFTPRSHARRTYRNFYAPESRWCAAGLRLARDA